MPEYKSIEQRVKEAVNIKLQLQQVGALLHEPNLKRLKSHSDRFIYDGVSSQFCLRVNETVRTKIVFCSTLGISSGVELEIA
jgi:hypothetical protein